MSNPTGLLDDQGPATPSVSPPLLRTMGLWSLVIYGVGDMLGSGIYALIGKAAGLMGNAIWLAFLASMIAAMLTGLSYASLGSRYPRAAGAAYVTHRAFGLAFLSYMIGLAVMASGLTSMATASRAFSGYLFDIMGHVPKEALVVGFILLLTLVNFWGMRESTWLNALCTTIEVTGLVIVIAVGLRYWGKVDYLQGPASGELGSGLSLLLVMQGGVLTFYSFVGFEDMLNVTEEVKNPQRIFPIGLILALIFTAIIYMAVSITAISVVPHNELAVANAPLVEVVRRAAPSFPPALFTTISLFAITNTALLNYIMGSRLVYGMAQQGFLPRLLGKVHETRRTPHVAIFALMIIVLVLALSGDISQLASATSLLLLCVFVIVNAALIVLQRRPGEKKGFFEIPAAVPVAGIVVCLSLIGVRVLGPGADHKAPAIAGALLAGIALLYLVARPKNITEETLAVVEEPPAV